MNLNLVMANGRGPRGTMIWPTTGVPASSVGINGDWAIDSAAEMLYPPKVNGAWSVPGISFAGSPNAVLVAAEAITGPALVNISSTFQVRHANAATGLPANGYITGSVASSGNATVYFSGLITGLTGLTGGPAFLSDVTPGAIAAAPAASGSGHFAQPVGVAISATSIIFNPGTMNGPV